MAYDNPIVSTYRFAAATFDTASTVATLLGPAGKKGRVIGISSIITADTTEAASTVQIGDGVDDDEYATHTVPIGAAGVTTNGFTAGDDEYIPADTDVVVKTGGEATAGDGDIILTIAWF